MPETMKTLKEWVRAGSNILREIDPHWFRKINPATINILDSQHCILAQVFEEFVPAANVIADKYKFNWFGNWLEEHGFYSSEDVAKVTELWQNTVNKLQQQDGNKPLGA